jgi:hypothetical protein
MEVNFENVESFYAKLKEGSADIYILCPKGNFNPINLKDVNNIVDFSFDNWINNTNWDLKCYYHRTGFFLMFFL